jgi:uncharacterized ion transporter superfamily protein YfcC
MFFIVNAFAVVIASYSAGITLTERIIFRVIIGPVIEIYLLLLIVILIIQELVQMKQYMP